jgi:hypothetical protein
MSKTQPKFGVFVDYSTGDSFRTEDIYDEDIGFSWRDYDKAVKAANLIKEHHELHEQYEDTGHWKADARKKLWNQAMQSEWRKLYKKLEPKNKARDAFELFYHFAVEDDDGNPVKINPFWIGYFEHLKGIRVKILTEEIL